MKNRMIARLSLIMLLMSAVALQSAYAQTSKLPDSSELYEVFGFETGKYTLTDDMKESLRKLTEGPSGFIAQCKAGNSIESFGYSDQQRYKNVSKEVSDRLNDILALERVQVANRYLIDELDMNEHCFNNNDAVFADSKVRGVSFAINERSGHSLLYKRLAEQVDSTKGILSQIQQEISDLHKKNAEQDERLDDHDERITENADQNQHQYELLDDMNNRVSALEKRSWNVSQYLGVGLNRFTDQNSFSGMAALQVGSIELSAWYSHSPDIGTETIGEDMDEFVPETIDLRRETYGAGLTWFGIQKNRYALGLMVKYEHGEDIEQDAESNVRKWDMVSAGLQAELKIYKSLRLRANVSHSVWDRLSTFDNPEYRKDTSPISGMVTIGLGFN